MSLPPSVRQAVENTDAVLELLPSTSVSESAWVSSLAVKLLLVGAASAFEKRLSSLVVAYISSATDGKTSVIELVRTQAVERKYHAWFDWDAKNVNRFLGMFGEAAKQLGVSELQGNKLDEARAFVSVGKARNLLVHGDFLESTSSYTREEALELIEKSVKFVDWVEDFLPRMDRDEEPQEENV